MNKHVIDNAIFPIRLYQFNPHGETVEILKSVDFDAILKTRDKPDDTQVSHSLEAFTKLLYELQTHEPELECTFVKTTIILANAEDFIPKNSFINNLWNTIRGVIELDQNAIQKLKQLWFSGDTNHTLILLKNASKIDIQSIITQLQEQRILVLDTDPIKLIRIMNWCHLSAMTAYMRILPI